MATAAAYPARVEAEPEPRLSRWLVKWLLVIPHVVVLSVLWLAYGVLTVVAFFAILFTGRSGWTSAAARPAARYQPHQRHSAPDDVVGHRM